MNVQALISKMESILEMENGSLTSETKFTTIEGWDSLAVLGIMAMVDAEAGITLSGDEITNAQSVNELYQLILSKK